MMTLKRIIRGWFRGKAWTAKRERRLEQWQKAREEDRRKLPPAFALTRWDSAGTEIVLAEGSYRQARVSLYDACFYAEPFKVAFVEGAWHYRPSGRAVSSNRLLSFLEAERVKRKHPHIFNPEAESDG